MLFVFCFLAAKAPVPQLMCLCIQPVEFNGLKMFSLTSPNRFTSFKMGTLYSVVC